jgi:3-carboxy-cis,cis-muconate cycloisomerase
MRFAAQGRAYDHLFSTAATVAALSDSSFLHQMHRFEVALAVGLERNGLAPAGTASDINAVDPDSFDADALARAAQSAGNVCIPFVQALTEAVRAINPTSAAYVHWGATSQDVIDTATMLQVSQVFALLVEDIAATCAHLALIIEAHKETVMPGRTWLQQGPPITLGLKIATWLDALHRHRLRLADVSQRCIVLQFGGAVGTLAAFGPHGPAVAHDLGAELKLDVPDLPWHTQRDRVAEIATTLGLLVGTLGKIARDTSLLMQTEVGEFLEPAGAGRGASSTMPHKRNPVSSSAILSAAIRVPGLVSTMLSAMVQEHERGVGGWQAEWETLSQILRLTAGAVATMSQLTADAVVDVSAMVRNLDLLQGVTMAEALSFALADKLGKMEAHRLLEEVSQKALREHLSMEEALSREPSVGKFFASNDLAKLLNPTNYLGSSHIFIDRVLATQAGQENAKD